MSNVDIYEYQSIDKVTRAVTTSANRNPPWALGTKADDLKGAVPPLPLVEAAEVDGRAVTVTVEGTTEIEGAIEVEGVAEVMGGTTEEIEEADTEADNDAEEELAGGTTTVDVERGGTDAEILAEGEADVAGAETLADVFDTVFDVDGAAPPAEVDCTDSGIEE